jgi:hypothetical protein
MTQGANALSRYTVPNTRITRLCVHHRIPDTEIEATTWTAIFDILNSFQQYIKPLSIAFEQLWKLDWT